MRIFGNISPWQLAGLCVPPVVLLIAGAFLTYQASQVNPLGCVDTYHFLPDWPMLASAYIALFAGRVLGPKLHPAATRPNGQRWGDLAGIFALMWFFAALSFALIYEAVAVTETSIRGAASTQLLELEPITQYVRCAVFYDKQGSPGHIGVASYVCFMVAGFLVGHWLWPWRAPEQQAPVQGSSRPTVQPGSARQLLAVLRAALITLVVVLGFGWAFVVLLSAAFGSMPNLRDVLSLARTGDSFRQGVAVVTGFVFAAFFAISILDLVFAVRGWASVGLRLQRWATANAWFVLVLVLGFSTLVTHLIGNDIRYGQG